MSHYINNKWNAQFSGFELVENIVHIWSVPLSIDAKTQNKYWSVLSDEEKSRANRYKFDILKTKFIACRGVLRLLMGAYLGIDANQVEISYIKNGKPNHHSNLEFNVSHSEDWAVIGFTLDTILGIDIECIKRNIEFEDIARRFFSLEESKLVINSPKEQLALYFYNCWTRKEAFVKALGDGLSFPLDQFEVSCVPSDPPQLLKTKWDKTEATKWSLWGFEKDQDYVGAITLKGPSKELLYYTWDHTSPTLEV